MIWYFMLSHSSFRGALQEDTAQCVYEKPATSSNLTKSFYKLVLGGVFILRQTATAQHSGERKTTPTKLVSSALRLILTVLLMVPPG